MIINNHNFIISLILKLLAGTVDEFAYQSFLLVFLLGIYITS